MAVAIGIILSFENMFTVGIVSTPVLSCGIPYGKVFFTKHNLAMNGASIQEKMIIVCTRNWLLYHSWTPLE
jgi:hypothetical protein